jgi:7-carboxy-7-deazaguanine synthase
MSITEILECIRPFHTRHVLLTGGEPLLQHNTPELVRLLTEQNYAVSIETHGEISIAPVAPLARIIMDIKTPSSGMCRWGFKQNLKHLKPNDEIKFVIASIEDYKWAREIIKSGANIAVSGHASQARPREL